MKLSQGMIAAAMGLLALAGRAQAAGVIDITESGGNVVATGSGDIDLTDLTFDSDGSFPSNGAIEGQVAGVVVGLAGADALYTGVTGPSSFGSGGFVPADSGSGDLFGASFGSYIIVPYNYVSGSELSGSSTFDGQTFATLGLTPGTYVYSWGAGPDADSLTINIGVVPTPEISTWAMMLAGFAGLGYAGFRARRKSADRAA